MEARSHAPFCLFPVEKGIFIVQGPFIKNITSFEGARIIDLAPSILYISGEEVPKDMDGRVLKDIIKDDFISTHPIRFSSLKLEEGVTTSDYSEEEEKYVRDKLQGLGYID